jgi:hypothetical protein
VGRRGRDTDRPGPANLALDDGWNISLGEVGATALVTGSDLQGLQDMFESGISDGTSSEASAAVDALPASGLAFATVDDGFVASQAISRSDGAVPSIGDPYPSIGISWGQLGLRVRSRVMGEARLSKEVVDLIVNDFDPARIDEYQVGNTGFRSVSFSEITAAYGTVLGERMAIGLSVRYVKGHKLTEGRFFEPVLDMVNETVEVSSVAIEAPGGSGFGVDLGFALDVGGGLRVSAGAVNVVQKMTWDDALIAHEATFFGCDCPQSDFDGDPEDLIDLYQASEVDPSSMSLYVSETLRGLLPDAFFPTIFRAGVGWRAGGTSLELVGASVSPKGRQHNQWDERVSLGLEQRLGFLTLRAGGAKGADGLQALSGGIGLGIGPVALDVSIGMMSGGFEFASGLVPPENVDYTGGHLTLSLQVMGGGS